MCTHTQKSILTDLCTHSSDIGGPLQKHVSWSDLWLFYRAVVADCSDVGLIHQCQNTLSHTQSRHVYKHNHTYVQTHVHKTHSIVLYPIKLLWLSALLPSRWGQRSGTAVDQQPHEARWVLHFLLKDWVYRLKFIHNIPDWACLVLIGVLYTVCS